MIQRRIEELSLNAWPALEQILYDGWILRFSNGYTKRANSVNPVYDSAIELEKKLSYCERIYAKKGLPLIFRLTPFASPSNLGAALTKRGFGRIDTTLVMQLNLKNWAGQAVHSTVLQTLSLNVWLEHYCRLSEASLEKHQTHREILQVIPSDTRFFALLEANQVLACGMGVLEGDAFGLFDIVVAPVEQNKGLGTALVRLMLRWAKQKGASLAYLQVVSSNTPAKHLYQKLEFSELYRYWYRVKELTRLLR